MHKMARVAFNWMVNTGSFIIKYLEFKTEFSFLTLTTYPQCGKFFGFKMVLIPPLLPPGEIRRSGKFEVYSLGIGAWNHCKVTVFPPLLPGKIPTGRGGGGGGGRGNQLTSALCQTFRNLHSGVRILQKARSKNLTHKRLMAETWMDSFFKRVLISVTKVLTLNCFLNKLWHANSVQRYSPDTCGWSCLINKTKQNKQKKVKFIIVYDYKFKLDNASS